MAKDLLLAVFRSEPESADETWQLSLLIHAINHPVRIKSVRYKRLRDVPDLVLQRLLKAGENPMAGLLDATSNAAGQREHEVRLAKWELARRKWVKNGGDWDLSKAPYTGPEVTL